MKNSFLNKLTHSTSWLPGEVLKSLVSQVVRLYNTFQCQYYKVDEFAETYFFYLWTMLSSSCWERVPVLSSNTSKQSSHPSLSYVTSSWIPGWALFFLDMGADLGREGEGDLSRPRKVLVEGEVMRRVECSIELQVGQSMLQRGEWIRGEGEK